jgi:hypothetical protein
LLPFRDLIQADAVFGGPAEGGDGELRHSCV